jgi:hypothetical protein
VEEKIHVPRDMNLECDVQVHEQLHRTPVNRVCTLTWEVEVSRRSAESPDGPVSLPEPAGALLVRGQRSQDYLASSQGLPF